jgi:hypothetical protein
MDTAILFNQWLSLYEMTGRRKALSILSIISRKMMVVENMSERADLV